MFLETVICAVVAGPSVVVALVKPRRVREDVDEVGDGESKEVDDYL